MLCRARKRYSSLEKSKNSMISNFSGSFPTIIRAEPPLLSPKILLIMRKLLQWRHRTWKSRARYQFWYHWKLLSTWSDYDDVMILWDWPKGDERSKIIYWPWPSSRVYLVSHWPFPFLSSDWRIPLDQSRILNYSNLTVQVIIERWIVQ